MTVSNRSTNEIVAQQIFAIESRAENPQDNYFAESQLPKVVRDYLKGVVPKLKPDTYFFINRDDVRISGHVSKSMVVTWYERWEIPIRGAERIACLEGAHKAQNIVTQILAIEAAQDLTHLPRSAQKMVHLIKAGYQDVHFRNRMLKYFDLNTSITFGCDQQGRIIGYERQGASDKWLFGSPKNSWKIHEILMLDGESN